MTSANDDVMRRSALAALQTRVAGPVAALDDDVVVDEGPPPTRRLRFSADEGSCVVLVQQDRGDSLLQIDYDGSAAAVELWNVDGPIAVFTTPNQRWSAVTAATGPVRVMFLAAPGMRSEAQLQTEWFVLP